VDLWRRMGGAVMDFDTSLIAIAVVAVVIVAVVVHRRWGAPGVVAGLLGGVSLGLLTRRRRPLEAPPPSSPVALDERRQQVQAEVKAQHDLAAELRADADADAAALEAATGPASTEKWLRDHMEAHRGDS